MKFAHTPAESGIKGGVFDPSPESEKHPTFAKKGLADSVSLSSLIVARSTDPLPPSLPSVMLLRSTARYDLVTNW